MSTKARPRFRLASLGFLRLGLYGLIFLSLVLPAGHWLAVSLMDDVIEQSVWTVIATLIAPVMAPILVVVTLFDYIMSRVRAADEQGELRAHFLLIGRFDLLFIGLMLIYWIPFFLML